MSNEGDSMNKKKVSAIILTVLTLLILTVSVPPTRAQFVLASWAYPDEYGQGIQQIQVEENSTASWIPVDLRDYSESQVYEWNVSVGIRLRLWCLMNNSLVGASSLEDGKNYQRFNTTVIDLSESIVFSQVNATYFVSYDTSDPIWLYEYYIILNFLPDYGEVYTVTVIYEIFW